MTITIDHHDIQKALTLYKLEVTEYYLEFTKDTVYMHWVACPFDVEEYLEDGRRTCLDIQIKGKWFSADEKAEDMPDGYIERPFTNCRYILATN
jgi:hypothetical protein